MEIDGSGHRAITAVIPVKAVCAATPKPRPFMKWKLSSFLDDTQKDVVVQRYQAAIAQAWEQQRVDVGLDGASDPETLLAIATGSPHHHHCSQTVHRTGKSGTRPHKRLVAWKC
jgi:hypothetical protein